MASTAKVATKAGLDAGAATGAVLMNAYFGIPAPVFKPVNDLINGAVVNWLFDDGRPAPPPAPTFANTGGKLWHGGTKIQFASADNGWQGGVVSYRDGTPVTKKTAPPANYYPKQAVAPVKNLDPSKWPGMFEKDANDQWVTVAQAKATAAAGQQAAQSATALGDALPLVLVALAALGIGWKVLRK